MVNSPIQLRIGVVGYSRPHFDHKKARTLLEKSFEDFIQNSPVEKDKIEIVSGLTNTGVPKLAYELAVQSGLKTIGISAKRAFKVKCGVFPVDQQIIIGKEFGDESNTFIQYIDCLVRIGGGVQSRNEVELFKAKHKENKLKLEQLLIEFEID